MQEQEAQSAGLNLACCLDMFLEGWPGSARNEAQLAWVPGTVQHLAMIE